MVNKSIRLKDIAKILNISESTISRVLSDDPRISNRTKKIVNETVKSLNYRPNLIARGLREKKTKTIGLIVSDITNPYYPEIIKGAEEIANKNGLNIILCNSDYNIQREYNYLNILLSKIVDGILLTPTGSIEDILSYLEDTTIPYVLMDIKPLKGYNVNCVYSDSEYGAYNATNFLIKQGHRNIALVNGPKTISPCQQLEKGFQKAIKENNISIPENYIKECDLKTEGGFNSTKELISYNRNIPTAIIYISDKTAEGGYQAIIDAGKLIPDDFSIIGCDDIPEARYFSPPLSTISHKKYELGSKSMSLLINYLSESKKKSIEKIRLLPELIIRESTKSI